MTDAVATASAQGRMFVDVGTEHPVIATNGWATAVRMAARLYDVAPESIRGRSRLPRLVMARREAWTTLRGWDWGWKEIAIVAGVDRTTVREGVMDYMRVTGIVGLR